MTYREFSTWNEVLSAAAAGEQLWYHAPLDRSPKYVRVVKVFKNGSIRIDPLSRDADKFTADAGHLSRFRYRVAEPRSNPTLANNPVSGGAVALAALAVAGVAWLFLRPKPAQAAEPGPTAELPSFVPETPAPAPAPAPPPVKAGPALPALNCKNKVYVTYKFKDQPAVINVFRRLTTWVAGGTPDSPAGTTTERVWAPSTTNSFFKIYPESTSFEDELEYAQDSLLKRYLAEAWVETADGWCLAATSTNYEPWSSG